jgi:subtilase family serine protease
VPVVFGLSLGGGILEEDGTSASSPFVAGMITLLNDIRLSQGYGPLGFINPLLYSMNSSSFHGNHTPSFNLIIILINNMKIDVTQGSNKCVPDQCTNNGFAAVAGWDPVTGLGTTLPTHSPTPPTPPTPPTHSHSSLTPTHSLHSPLTICRSWNTQFR